MKTMILRNDDIRKSIYVDWKWTKLILVKCARRQDICRTLFLLSSEEGGYIESNVILVVFVVGFVVEAVGAIKVVTAVV